LVQIQLPQPLSRKATILFNRDVVFLSQLAVVIRVQ
jgi:hypothetical protein